MAKDGEKIEDACIFLLSQTILEDKSLHEAPMNVKGTLIPWKGDRL